MKKAVVVLLLIALFTTMFTIHIKPAHATAYAVHFNNAYPFNSVYNAVNFGGLLPGDHLHILSGHSEVLPPGGLIISTPNLWIIGAPPMTGAVPTIDVAGQTISVAGPNIFIWGIIFFDSTASSLLCISLPPASGGSTIQSCIIKGGLVPGSTGISISASPNNFIACNDIIGWDVGIFVRGPGSTGNIIKLNNIDNSGIPPTSRGVQVSAAAGGGVPNQVFWNDIIGIPSPPGSGLGQELYDVTPGNPPNIFDDLAQPPGYTWSRGNYESSWAIPPPYPVAGPGGNGWFDNLPNLGNTPIVGDLDLSGQVNIFDAIRFAATWGAVWCTANWDPREDINGDGVIDIFDAILLAGNFGVTYPPSPAPT